MERSTAINYLLEVEGGLDQYAKAVLHLTNIKSTYKNTVLDIKTLAGTDRICVVSFEKIDGILEQYGQIIDKDDVHVLTIEAEDLPAEAHEFADHHEEEMNDYFLHYTFNGEY
jgi:ACT domain-containing protein